ncbi:MAG: carbonic anhydrase family protein [Dechloromonas sp.]|nr:carbonic anhydrase family protein [Dechloromonas sp.]
MRLIHLAAVLAALPFVAQAAPTWQVISSEPGKRIELDRTSIKREGNVVQAQGRVVLERALSDYRSGADYRVIEAITRYDCTTRNATTIKRIYKQNENDVIREETVNSPELPVRTGTLDDKVLREVCRPTKDSASELAQKANEAASQLKAANEAMLKQEAAKEAAKQETAPAMAQKAIEKEEAPIPSIRPNLREQAEKARAALAAAQEPAAKPAAHTPPDPAPPSPAPAAAKPSVSKGTYIVRTNTSTHPSKKKEKAAPHDAPAEGYMLELKANAAALQHAHIHWDYEGVGGPENWAKIDPANKLCATGERQSPIDIREGIRVDLEPIRFNYRPSTFRIVDNGHTVQVAVGDSSISLTGKTYELVQFHFHRPSEEKVDGQRFDMVAHLVHKSDDGQLAVVAVLLTRGTENPFIQTLWNNLPLEKNTPVAPPETIINPETLLPEARNYYTYMGSLTTPPCTEGVRWLVLKQPVALSDEQIKIFSRLYRNNARPIQRTSERLIKEGR